MISNFGAFELPLADHYRFEAELGRGGMGTVYRAWDLKLERAVAIKMLHPVLTSELGVARFRREILTAASLSHPNIVSVYESGEVDGQLFYVMPFIGGQTLRARLKREKQLSVEDALRIAEDVGTALQFAHDHGVVHRDIKPDNILLANGHAYVLDFGLAKALDNIDVDVLTASGLAVGTPHYMSPEQASAEREIGPKADQYSLACVVYEMLVGEPPFTGPSLAAVIHGHLAGTAVAMRKRRASTPEAVEAAVGRAMEKVPADRWGSVMAFIARATAVAPASPHLLYHKRPRYGRRARTIALASLAALVIFLAVASTGLTGVKEAVWNALHPSLDDAAYVVLPFTSEKGHQSESVEPRIRDALRNWVGVRAPTATEVTEALSRVSSTEVTPRLARRVAQSLGARWCIVGTIADDGVTRRMEIEAIDATGRAPTRLVHLTLPSGVAVPDSLVSHIAYKMLFDGDVTDAEEANAIGTTNYGAFQSFLRARSALRSWRLFSAESAFTEAVTTDQAFPQAWLGLAQVHAWLSDDPPDANGQVEHAIDRRARLTATDIRQALALRDLLTRHYHEACLRFDTLLTANPLDFAAWYGSAECNRRDKTVIVSVRSPSHHIFRGSAQRVAIASARAFSLLSEIDSCCISRADSVMRRGLSTEAGKVQFGRGKDPDTTTYGAYPELIADTIAFIPRPVRELNKAPPPSYPDALHQQRERFYSIAVRRASLFPNNSKSLEEIGEAMDLLGDPAAMDSIRRARVLARSDADVFRLTVYELWMNLKVSLPGRQSEVGRVKLTAESLLVHAKPSSATACQLLAGLALLLGDANRAAAVTSAMNSAPTETEFPPSVLASANEFLAFAAAGGPVDSLRDVDARLMRGITNEVLPRNQDLARTMLVGRAARLSFPVYRATAFSSLDTSGYLIAAENAFLNHDTSSVRAYLAKLESSRRNTPPADLTLDALYPEAWLRSAIGDSAGALSVIAPTLDALRSAPASNFLDPAIAGSLMRAMSLRVALMTTPDERIHAAAWARSIKILINTKPSPPVVGRSKLNPLLVPLTALFRHSAASAVQQPNEQENQ